MMAATYLDDHPKLWHIYLFALICGYVDAHRKYYNIEPSTNLGIVGCLEMGDGPTSQLDCALFCFAEHGCVAFSSTDSCNVCWSGSTAQLASQTPTISPTESVYASAGYASCEAGWLSVPGHGCYKAVMDTMGWDAAQANCDMMNAYLVCFETREESDAVTAMLIETFGIVDYYRMWTGARRAGLHQDFHWQEIGGVVPIDDRWEAGDPDMSYNHFGMAIRSTGDPSYGWNDYALTTLCQSLCEAY